MRKGGLEIFVMTYAEKEENNTLPTELAWVNVWRKKFRRYNKNSKFIKS